PHGSGCGIHGALTMTLRTKLMLSLASLAAAATIAIGFFSYAATAERLNAQINSSIDTTASGMVTSIQHGDFDAGLANFRQPRPRTADPLLLQQVLTPSGQVFVNNLYQGQLPVTQQDRNVAVLPHQFDGVRRTVKLDGRNFRMDTVAVGNGQGAVQVARDLTEN